MLHSQLGLTSEALDSFPIKALLRAADITMWIPTQPPIMILPILPRLLTQMSQLSTSLGAIAQVMGVCLMFRFYGML